MERSGLTDDLSGHISPERYAQNIRANLEQYKVFSMLLFIPRYIPKCFRATTPNVVTQSVGDSSQMESLIGTSMTFNTSEGLAIRLFGHGCEQITTTVCRS